MWGLETGRFSFRAPRSARLTPALQTGRLVLGSILFCPAAGPSPSNALPFLGSCRRWSTGGFVCVLAWGGNSRKICPRFGPPRAQLIPFSVPLHPKYCTEDDTSTEMPGTLCARSHAFTLSDKHHVHNLRRTTVPINTSAVSFPIY